MSFDKDAVVEQLEKMHGEAFDLSGRLHDLSEQIRLLKAKLRGERGA